MPKLVDIGDGGPPVQFPDNMTDEQIGAAIKNSLRAKPTPSIPLKTAPVDAGTDALRQPGADPQGLLRERTQAMQQKVAQDMSPTQAAIVSAGRTSDRLWEGAEDVWQLPQSLMGDQQAQQDRAQRAQTQGENTRLFAPLEQASPVATAVGGAAPYMAAPPMGGAVGNIIAPALMGLTEYGSPTEKLQRGAMAAAGGMVANTIPRLVGGRASEIDDPYLRNTLKRGEDLGFIPLPSEKTRSRAAQIKEAKIESDPRTTEYIGNIYEHNTRRLTGIAAEAIGLPPGTERLSPDVLDAAHKTIGQKFNQAAQGVQIDVTTQPFLTKIAGINNKFLRGPGRRGNQVFNAVDDLEKRALQGPLTPEEYLTFTSTLAADARGARASGKNGVAESLEDLRKALDEAFDNSAGNTALLKEARNQWRTLLAVREATDEAGDVSFGKLSTTFKKDTFGYKRGNVQSDLYDAVRFFKSFPKNFGRSGTAERRPIPTMLESGRKGAMTGALAGGGLGQILGAPGTGALAGGILGGMTGAVGHATSPTAAQMYLSPALNAGLIPMEAGTQRALGQGLSLAGLAALAPKFQSTRSKDLEK